MIRMLVAVVMAFAAAVLPARAFAADRPEKLTNAQLDRVHGGLEAFVLGPELRPPVVRLPIVGPTILAYPGHLVVAMPALSPQPQVASGR